MTENMEQKDENMQPTADKAGESASADTVPDTAEAQKDAGETFSEDEGESEGKLKGADKKRLKKAEAELTDTKKRLDAAQEALAQEKDKYLRMLAEYDNYRRRTAKEKEGIYSDAYADAVKTILPIIDNLERAVAGIPPEEADSPVAKGVNMTLKAAAESLSKLDVTEVETKIFDPKLHNAVMHVEDETRGEGEIVEVFQKGYAKGDKVIRYAMVKVAN